MKTDRTIRGYVRCALLLLLLPAGACTGISDRQLMADPVVYEAEKLVKAVHEKGYEFDQLVAEYRLTEDPVYLRRMTALTEQVREDADLARKFYKDQRYYPKGMSYQRWAFTRDAAELSRKSLCGMMLRTAELEMVHGDKKAARQIFEKVVADFPGAEFKGYVRQARNRLHELDSSDPPSDGGKNLAHAQ